MSEPEMPPKQASAVLQTRGYQQEMLDESLRSNLIIALDTGSGKTHIAVLRMKLEAEHETKKVSWFLAPTVALVEQQRRVIADNIPVSVGMISGSSEPNQWKDKKLWRRILASHRIMVTTPQVLLDALLHGYVDLGSDVGLLVFDEAHHAVLKHPYNMIMGQFYFSLTPRTRDNTSSERVRPMILGLTASPIYGGNVDLSFHALEKNLDCIIRSPRTNRDELDQYVHKPVFSYVLYAAPDYSYDDLPSLNYVALQAVVDSLNIENDPYVKSLRAQLAKARTSGEIIRLDQALSKAIDKQDTFTHRGLRDFARTASDICFELGVWAADWYVATVIEQGKLAANPYNNIMSAWQEKEKTYLLDAISRVRVLPVADDHAQIRAGISPKVHKLIECLKAEHAYFREHDETYSGIIFVTRRDAVLALAEILKRLPETTELFRVGRLIGSSSSLKRHSFLDITRNMVQETQTQTLNDFKIGDLNLIVSTSVAEEGIDIQACSSVVRFDPPPNAVGWAQSRGRARRKRSRFTIMFGEDAGHEATIRKFENIEAQMMALYNDVKRIPQAYEDDDEEDRSVVYTVESTGAILTLHSATSHLNHFCAVLPNSGYGGCVPVCILDPPDYVEGWHSGVRIPGLPYEGPWGATIFLPRMLDKKRVLRTFSTPRIHRTKLSAQRHAAFNAYKTLHKEGLLNDNLLPLTSAIEPDKGEEVKKLLEEIEKRASTANVSVQMDPWAATEKDEPWWSNQLVIEGLPAMRMLTRNPLPAFSDEDFPLLYVPGSAPRKARVRHLGAVETDGDYIGRARRYTLHMFASLYGARMNLTDIDFAYLFFPEVEGVDEPRWNERREWMRTRVSRTLTTQLENKERANAQALGEKYSFPTDLALVRPVDAFGKPCRFVRWYNHPVTSEEEEELMERYDGFPEFRITYPLLEVKPFPQRANFLQPLTSETEGLGRERPFLIHPQFATVVLISDDDVQYAVLLPSFLWWLNNALTAVSLRDTLFASSSVAHVPLSLLTTAITAPVSQEATNYQRLETLGDTVLKFIVSIQVFADHPLWHEGYLARRKDHVVSNVKLAQEAIRKGLYQWIIRNRFVPRKWKPRYLTNDPSAPVAKEDTSSTSPDSKEKGKIKEKKKRQDLSTKVLADVVEALIGASYEHGGFDIAIDCVTKFGLGLSWQKLPARIDAVLANAEDLEDPPAQLVLVENMLGYEFKRKTFLVQALTHASYHGELSTISYERLEFLGDSALDMVVTDYLYHAPKNYSPGHMHMRKEAVVNSHFLAYICLSTSVTVDSTMANWTMTEGLSETTEQQKIHLWKCLMHSSQRVMEDQNIAFTRFEKNGASIKNALLYGTVYPYAALASLQAPKFISDMVESLLGAVYVDSAGDLRAVHAVMTKLGITQVLERIVDSDMEVLHPVSRLAIWAAAQDPQQKMRYQIDKTHGNVVCTLFMYDADTPEGQTVWETEIASATERYRSRASQEEVRFAVAERALKLLHVRGDEDDEPDSEDSEGGDDDWGDVPEYDW
ncbi:P-loop containing nucleoside triphosphate hydrolase protein [Amylocystis lapponica]|nr:P-loop containing nucleoside triphosphate hydrolase protein [Amylocystis lapponica]